MRRRKDEAAAHYVEPISGSVILVENGRECGSLVGRGRGRVAPVVEDVCRPVRKQQDVAGDQLEPWAALRVLQDGRPAEYDMIGDLAELGRRKVDAPGRAEKASVIERASDRDHLQKPAQPVAGVFHIDLAHETNGYFIEIICHSEFQA